MNMKQNYSTPEEFAADVTKYAKNDWVNGSFDVNGTIVGIKAYGKWVQRINANCLTDGAEFKTQKAMREFIVSHIGHN